MTHYLIIKHAHIARNLSTAYPNINISNLNFVKINLQPMWDAIISFEIKKFEVLMCDLYKNETNTNGNKLYCFLKPIDKYECVEFEELFGFKAHCENFDSNRIIAVEYASKNGIIQYLNSDIILD